jgi:hypothetical protein
MRKTNSTWTIQDLRNRKGIIEFPEYQREPTVWNLQKKQRLIDSILRDFDIAPIYLFKKDDETYDCIDGRQRINAILSYLGENESDTADNMFHLRMTNEIFDDADQFRDVIDKRFPSLTHERKNKILNYEINVVEIEGVENEEELNLLFLRLQLGSILNAGEKLHAMTGDMRDYIFYGIGRHDVFQQIRIPYRRYAREQVAAQIALNFFSKRRSGEFHRSRYLDLQEFFKEQNKLSAEDKKLTEEIVTVLDKIRDHFRDKLRLIGNRAIAVSVFLFVSELIEQGKEDEIGQFVDFFIKFMRTLKWQISKGVQMDEPYYDLLKFQTHVTQAAGEKYAIQNRHDFWREYFYHFKTENVIKGDKEYLDSTGRLPDGEREAIEL